MWCSLGKHDVSAEEFYVRGIKKDGSPRYQTGCKECNREYRKRHYTANREYYIEKASRSNKKTVEMLRDLKRDLPCEQCGHKGHPAAMHWHHRNRLKKEFDLGRGRDFGRERILQEVAKCKLLCADCHAEIEYGKPW